MLAYRLIEFAQAIVREDTIESICPEKLQVINFDEEDLNIFTIVRADESDRIKDRLKFYQAPEVLVGQP